MLKSKLLIGALIAAFAIGVPTEMVSAKSKAKATHKRTVADCTAKYKSYNPFTQMYFGKDGKFHKCP
jgi:hypothetical protein